MDDKARYLADTRTNRETEVVRRAAANAVQAPGTRMLSNL